MNDSDTPSLLRSVIDRGAVLTREESAAVFSAIMEGRVADDELERFLIALADRGETIDEIVGAAEAMRGHVTRIECPFPDAIDTCGTGGDGISTFNVSTAAAIVAAAGGAKVAKHGNRSNNRRSGSAEELAAMGVNIDAPPHTVGRCIAEIGVGFLFAARLHSAMKRVVPIRRRLGRHTIFNLIGPLTNPAGVRRQLIGVPNLGWMEKIAEALRRLGCVRAIVVHGDDGLCDFTITAQSRYVDLTGGVLSRRGIQPEDVGLARGLLKELLITSPEESAGVIRDVFAGRPGPCRDHTLINAAAALVVAGVAEDLRDGVDRAADAIDTGRAASTLAALAALSRC